MTDIKSKIYNLFKTRRVNLFLGFILLAFIILLLTKLERTYTKTIVYTIEANNLPEEVVILNDSTNTLKITLETFGFDWLQRAFSDKTLAINFKDDVTKTDSMYIWSQSKGFSSIREQFSKDVKLLSIYPDTLKFKYDINTIKYVPIKLNATIQFTSGYNALNPMVLEPDSVKIIGPHSILEKIKEVETEEIEFKDINKTVKSTLSFKLDAIDENITIFPKEVTVLTETKKFTEGTLEIPVEVINVPRRIRIKHFPKKVTVSYKTSLENYKTVMESDFKVVCDYSKVTDEAYYLVPELTVVPKVVKNARVEQQKVEFILTK